MSSRVSRKEKCFNCKSESMMEEILKVDAILIKKKLNWKRSQHEVANYLNVYVMSHAHVMIIILQGPILTNCDINYLLW